jgi:hypothetical protein
LCEQDLRRRFSAEGSRGVTLEGEARCKDAFPKHVLDSALERAFRLPPLLLPVARTSCRAGATCGSSPSSRPWRQLYAPSSREAAERRKLVGLALRPEPRLKARRPPTRSGARGDEPRRTGFDCGASTLCGHWSKVPLAIPSPGRSVPNPGTETRMAFTYRLEHEDGTPADPLVLQRPPAASGFRARDSRGGDPLVVLLGSPPLKESAACPLARWRP